MVFRNAEPTARRANPAGCLTPPGWQAATPEVRSGTLVPAVELDLRGAWRPAGAPVYPAGDVTLTSGNPPATYDPGTYQFESHLLAFGADPQLNTSAFPAALARTLGEILGDRASLVSASASKTGSQTIALPPSTADRLLSALNTGAAIGSVAPALAGPAGVGIAVAAHATTATTRALFAEALGRLQRRQGTGWWITVRGTFNARLEVALRDLNRAISRAVAQCISGWSNVQPYAGPRPTDGASLHATFLSEGACTGFADYTKVWARACTRVVPARGASSSVQTQVVPGAMSPTDQAVVAAAAASRPCIVAPVSRFWLRPVATFDHTGPVFNAGTPILLLGRTRHTRGDLTLYRVRVSTNNAEGYAALAAADLAPAPGTAGCAGTPANVPLIDVPLHAAPPSAPSSTRPLPQLQGAIMPPAEEGLSTGAMVGVAAAVVATAAAGGYLYLRHKRSKAGRASAAHASGGAHHISG